MPISAVTMQRAVEHVLERAPEPLSEPWLRTAWAGSHGRLGLHVDPFDVSSMMTLTDEGMRAKAIMRGSVVDPSDKAVGSIVRAVNLAPNGRLNVYHEWLKLDPEVHKSGFARSLNEAAFRTYAQGGVDDVTLTAGLTSGGYVWARTGFELAASGATDAVRALKRARTIRDLVTQSRDTGRISAAEYDALAPRLVGDALRRDTLTSIRELAQMEGIGERLLKGTSWKGILPLKTTTPWWHSAAGRGGVDAAAESTAYLRHELERPDGVVQAHRAITELVPEALNASRLVARIEQASASHGVPLTHEYAPITELDLVNKSISSRAWLHMIDDAGAQQAQAHLELYVDPSDGSVVASRRWTNDEGMPIPTKHAAGQVIDRVLREAGTDRITDI